MRMVHVRIWINSTYTYVYVTWDEVRNRAVGDQIDEIIGNTDWNVQSKQLCVNNTAAKLSDYIF